MPTSQKVVYKHRSSVSTKLFNANRTVQWIGGINGGILADITDRIQTLIIENPLEQINLIVTSHGGPTGIGMSFYDTMRSVYKANLCTIGSGDVDSSGIIVFLAGNERYLTPNTTLLLHLAGRVFDTQKRFTSPEMESIIKEDKLKDFQYASVIAEQSGNKLTVQKVLDMMARNTVLSPSEAVELGIAQGILDN